MHRDLEISNVATEIRQRGRPKISTAVSKTRTPSPKRVSLSEQLVFFMPLALTAILMTLTHSLFNAGLARLSSPEVYLSAFAVAKSFMHLMQSPIIMVRQTVAALIHDLDSFLMVRKFIFSVISLIVGVFSFLAFSGIARWIIENIMGLTGETLDVAVRILYILILFPIGVTIRDFYQGLLIKFEATPLITIGTIGRTIFVGLYVANITRLTVLPGWVIAGMMILGAIIVEALVIVLGTRLAHGSIRAQISRLARKSKELVNKPLNNQVIFSFYWPLIVTAFIQTLATPVINTGLARTSQPELALAAYAVAWGLGMVILSPMMMFQQVPISFLGEKGENRAEVKRFALLLGLASTCVLGITAFTSVGFFILRHLIGATDEISVLAMDVLRIMTLLPLLVVTREFYWGVLIYQRRTNYLGKGKVVNVIALTLSILLMTLISPANPAITGAVAIVVSETSEILYLYYVTHRVSKTTQAT